MDETFDLITVYRELRQKQQRGGPPPHDAVVTRRVLAGMESVEASIGDVPERERDL